MSMVEGKKISKISSKNIKNVDWKYLVNRRETLLFSSLSSLANLVFEKLVGVPWLVTKRVHLGTGEILHSAAELDSLALIFKHGGNPFLIRFAKLLVFHVSAFDKLARRFGTVNCAVVRQRELCAFVDSYIAAALNAHNFLVPMAVADRALSSLILEHLPPATEARRQQWLGVLAFPQKENEHIKEEKQFYALVEAHQRGDVAFSRLLKRHVAQYGLIGARWYWWQNAWTEQDVSERITAFIQSGKRAPQTLAQLRGARSKQQQEKQRLASKFKLIPAARTLVALAAEYAYLRTWRTDIIYGAGYRARTLFFEVMRRADLSGDDALYLTFQELQVVARTKQLPFAPRELSARKHFFSTVLADGQLYVLSGSAGQKQLAFLRSSVNENTTVKGMTAYAGWARGRVAVVRQSSDIAKVKAGDILVAVMTFPHFIAAMEKAAAFVTDEGGILCHAAIIAREMRKPCVIGTKQATQILKDGDEVEVDAGKGIVKKIKK